MIRMYEPIINAFGLNVEYLFYQLKISNISNEPIRESRLPNGCFFNRFLITSLILIDSIINANFFSC